MTLCLGVATSRRKAVWGPKRTLAAVALIVLGLAPGVFAEGRHQGAARKAQAGGPNSNVRRYKIDGELTRRAGNALSNRELALLLRLLVMALRAAGEAALDRLLEVAHGAAEPR